MALTMHARGSNTNIDWEVVVLHLDGYSMDEIVARILESTMQAELRGRPPCVSSLLSTGSYTHLDVSQYLWTAFPGTSSTEVSPAKPVPPPPPPHPHSAPSAAISFSAGVTATNGGGSGSGGGVTKASVSPPSDSATVYSESERLAVVEFVEDHLQFLKLLEEELLPAPYVFVSTNASPLNRRDTIRLLELYYGLDDGLAELWFGDRLSRIEVEDDDLVEVGLPGLRQGTVQRQWRNLKRVCKTITAAYRGKDGMLIPRDIPLTQAIAQVFVVPQELCQTYATLVFGFEHRLDCVSLEEFHMHELSSLCSAVGSLWCDASSLFLSEDFCKRVWRIGQILLDSRVVSELAVALLGTDASKLLRQIKDTLGEVQKAIAPSSTMSPSPLHAAAAAAPASATSHVSSSTSASGCSVTSDGSSSLGMTPGTGIASPPVAAPPQHHHGHSHGHAAYSRRFVNEFHTVVRNLARICVQFGTAEKLRDVLDRYYTKIYAPLAVMGRDVSSETTSSLRAGWSPAVSTVTSYPAAANAGGGGGAGGLGAASSEAALRAAQYQVTNASFVLNSSTLFAGGSSGDLAPSSLHGPSSGGGSMGGPASAAAPTIFSGSTNTVGSSGSSVGGGATFSGSARGGGGGSTVATMPLADSRRYVRELCQFLPAFHRTFCALQTVSTMEHAVLDGAAKDFFSVLRLYSQLLLAHD